MATSAVTAAGAPWVLRPTGDLDYVTADELTIDMGALRAAGAASVVVDLAGVDFVDSSGLGALVMLRRQVEAAHVTLMTRAPAGPVRDTIVLAGLQSFLNVLPDDEWSSTAGQNSN